MKSGEPEEFGREQRAQAAIGVRMGAQKLQKTAYVLRRTLSVMLCFFSPSPGLVGMAIREYKRGIKEEGLDLESQLFLCHVMPNCLCGRPAFNKALQGKCWGQQLQVTGAHLSCLSLQGCEGLKRWLPFQGFR